MCDVRHAISWVVIDDRIRDGVLHAGDETVSQPSSVFAKLLAFILCKGHGLANADDCGHVFCAGPALPLLTAARDYRVDPHTAADIQHAYTFRSVHLVAGKRQHVYSKHLHIARQFASRLDRIRVNQDLGPDCRRTRFHRRRDACDI